MTVTETTTVAGLPWVEVNLPGLRQILVQKGVDRVLLEAVTNALDTDGFEVSIEIQSLGERRYRFVVTDDDPNGFADLRDSYMLFARSKRRGEHLKSGRFGAGEKELLSVCFENGEVALISTKGCIRWDAEGRHEDSSTKTSVGTVLEATFVARKKDIAGFVKLMRQLIVREGRRVSFVYDGEQIDIPSRRPLFSFEEPLPSVMEDEQTGSLRHCTKRCVVAAYEVLEGEKPYLFELGIPVVRASGTST